DQPIRATSEDTASMVPAAAALSYGRGFLICATRTAQTCAPRAVTFGREMVVAIGSELTIASPRVNKTFRNGRLRISSRNPRKHSLLPYCVSLIVRSKLPVTFVMRPKQPARESPVLQTLLRLL